MMRAYEALESGGLGHRRGGILLLGLLTPAKTPAVHHLNFGGIGFITLPETLPYDCVGEVLLLDEMPRVVMRIEVPCSVAQIAHEFGRSVT